MPITEKRLEKFKEVVSQRQMDLTVVLENIHDPHNIGAVLRSCDSVGISEIYVILTDPQIDSSKYKIGKKSSSSSRKWIDVKMFSDLELAISEVRKKYKNLLGTHLSATAKGLYDLDLTDSVALVFGNEHDGISEELLSKLDGNFIIPQFGMVQSLNISVACAVSLYECCRQRIEKDKYNLAELNPEQSALLKKYLAIHENGYRRNR